VAHIWRGFMTAANQRTLFCDVCNYMSPHTTSLKNHVRTHTGETPYVCRNCLRGFKQKGNLRVHLMNCRASFS
jgi:KRAB domain-containing zinc finger protein